MIVYDLREFGLKLKKELQENASFEVAKRIALEIKTATHPNGVPLTSEEKEHILRYIEYPAYNHKTGQCVLQHADNSEFLKLVALISKSVRENK